MAMLLFELLPLVQGREPGASSLADNAVAAAAAETFWPNSVTCHYHCLVHFHDIRGSLASLIAHSCSLLPMMHYRN